MPVSSKFQSLGHFIRRRRLELGLTQEELAERIGETVRQAEVSRLENDRIALPRRARMVAIAGALEVSLGELLLRSGWMEEDLVGEADEILAETVPAEPAWEVRVPKQLHTVPLPELITLLERMGEAQDQVTAAGVALEAGRKAVTAELQSQVDDAHPRPEISPPIGILEGQEASAAFQA